MNIITRLSEIPCSDDEIPRDLLYLRDYIIENRLQVEESLHFELAKLQQNPHLVENIIGLLFLLAEKTDRIEMGIHKQLANLVANDSLPNLLRIKAARLIAVAHLRYTAAERDEIVNTLQNISTTLKLLQRVANTESARLIESVLSLSNESRRWLRDFNAMVSWDGTFQTKGVSQYVLASIQNGYLHDWGFEPQHSEYIEHIISRSLTPTHLNIARGDWLQHKVTTWAVFNWTPISDELTLLVNWKCNFRSKIAELLTCSPR